MSGRPPDFPPRPRSLPPAESFSMPPHRPGGEDSPFGAAPDLPKAARAATKPPSADAPPPRRPAAPPRGPLLPPSPPRRPPDFAIATVNIVLLLVLFFLVAGTLVAEEEGALPLPETEGLPLEALPRPLLLVGAEGRLALDGETVAEEALAGVVAGLGAERLYLLAPRDLPAARLMAVMGVLAEAGPALSLVTIRREGGP